MPHFWELPRAIQGTTPCDLASVWLRREHKQPAPLIPSPMLPMLPTLLQHWLDGFSALFLLAATHGIIWKTSHREASDDTAISEDRRRVKQRASVSRGHLSAEASCWQSLNDSEEPNDPDDVAKLRASDVDFQWAELNIYDDRPLQYPTLLMLPLIVTHGGQDRCLRELP